MKKCLWCLMMILSLNFMDFYFLPNGLTQPLEHETTDVELRLGKLKEEVKKEEEPIEVLNKRYAVVLREKEKLRSLIEQENQRIEEIEKARLDKLRRAQLEQDRLKEEQNQIQRELLPGETNRQGQERLEQEPLKKRKSQTVKSWLDKIQQSGSRMRKNLW